MTGFSFLALLFGAAAILVGTLALVFRCHVLAFVQKRYAKIFQEDGLTMEQTEARTPKMGAVVIIASGFEVVGALFIGVGILALVG